MVNKSIPSWQTKFSLISLAQKGLLVIGLPIVFQITALVVFFFCDNGDSIAFQAGLTRNRTHAIRVITYREISILLAVEKGLSNLMPSGASLNRDLRGLQYFSESLHTLSQNPTTDDLIAKKLLGETAAVISLLSKYEEAVSNNELTSAELSDKLVKSQIEFSRLRKEIQSLLYQLTDIKRVPPVLDTASHVQFRDFTFGFVVAASVVNLVALLVMAYFFYRTIAQKLAALEHNCMMIGRGQISYTPMPGSDELAKLDQRLHKLAISLADEAEKQRAVFENAHDVLCYLTEDSFCFTSVNKAAIDIFQFEPKKLQGETIESVIHPGDRTLARQNIQAIVNARSKPPFEMCAVEGAPFVVRVNRRDNTIAHTVWTVQYIPSSHNLFCVVHDFTDQISAQNTRKEIAQMVNHDLRSPLNAIRVVYSILEVSATLTEPGQKSLAQASANTDRMLRLINELLDVEKLEEGLLTLEKQDFNLRGAVESSIQAAQSIAEIKKIKIQNNVNDFVINADEYRIIQVLINLLSNAIKFSPKAGSINISSQQIGNYIEVTVADNGRGIPASVIDQIFDRFQQVKKSDASKEGGSGLGLAICKSLIKLHGGTIGVESEEGKGSRFYFRIPC